jgi:hypothetical protein
VSRLTAEDRYNGADCLGGVMTWDLVEFKLEGSAQNRRELLQLPEMEFVETWLINGT